MGASEEIRDQWDRIASGYREFVTPTHLWLGGEGLRRAGLCRGMSFLDVAAGSGALSIPAARLGGRVLSTDLSPAMLAQLESQARQEGLSIETRVMDGEALALPDAAFDVAGSQFGVMLFPDMPKGVREMARVVRPGGRVLMTVYGDPNRVEFFGFFVQAIKTVRPEFTGPPMNPPPLPFQLQDPNRLQQELEHAGLADVRVDTVTEELRFDDGSQLWNWLANSNPIVGAVLGALNLTDDELSAIRHALDGMIASRSGGRGAAFLTNPINIGVGTKQPTHRSAVC